MNKIEMTQNRGLEGGKPAINIEKFKGVLGKVPESGCIEKGGSVRKNSVILEWDENITLLKKNNIQIVTGKNVTNEAVNTVVGRIAVESARVGRVPDMIHVNVIDKRLGDKGEVVDNSFKESYPYVNSDVKKVLLAEGQNLNPEYVEKSLHLLEIGRKLGEKKRNEQKGREGQDKKGIIFEKK